MSFSIKQQPKIENYQTLYPRRGMDPGFELASRSGSSGTFVFRSADAPNILSVSETSKSPPPPIELAIVQRKVESLLPSSSIPEQQQALV